MCGLIVMTVNSEMERKGKGTIIASPAITLMDSVQSRNTSADLQTEIRTQTLPTIKQARKSLHCDVRYFLLETGNYNPIIRSNFHIIQFDILTTQWFPNYASVKHQSSASGAGKFRH
jgi:hypothetical protein